MRSFLRLLFTYSIFSITLTAQVNNRPVVQPTIMVVPFAKEGERLRTAYENSEVNRIAITKVKEAFDKRGVNTIDLIGKLKQTNNNTALQQEQANETMDQVVSLSGADIYVVVEATRKYSPTGNSVTVILTAYDAFSGESLANKVGNSPLIYTDNFDKLIEKAVETEIDNLLNTLQEKFTILLNEGRSIVVTIGVESNTVLTLEKEINDSGDLLSEVIEDWIKANAFKGNYHLQGVTRNKMIFDIVKIPIHTPSGTNYRLRDFTSELRKYLRSINLSTRQTVQGNNVVFTLSEGKEKE
ncbi:MAG: hypothetical protein K1X68_06465 [Saprospiraceae bacterium]|nr:hypothetical protein [Saprospiraceae bacterium]HMW38322.1 DUF6175 family protein [Saprospiraceae bacterium]HMX88164.1 DUF6175 family protein [Saprospiraceae bacterium]HMZ39903.1 DUF6175 family protein [Saprospiraceae bacterium]HNA63986.1 DUF6175 family protein [Saprospiraceae bacterium]